MLAEQVKAGTLPAVEDRLPAAADIMVETDKTPESPKYGGTLRRNNGGVLPEDRGPSFVIRGTRGTFKVQPGASEGTLTVIDPDFSFPRRRSSVRTPELVDMHENVPVKTFKVELEKGTLHGPSAFWKHLYDTVRTAAPFPLALEDSLEAVKFAHLMKKTSPFGK